MLGTKYANERKVGFMPVLKTMIVKAAAAVKGKGTFIALAACIAAVGGAGVYAYNKTVDSLNKNLSVSGSPSESKPEASSSGAHGAGDTDIKDDSLSSELEAVAQVQPRVYPVTGEVLSAFSDGELVYNQTLGVWETHNGIDIAAENGVDVVAMTGGVVDAIWDDPLWGCCVSVDHQNSVVSYYYGLSNQLAVTVGDTVDSGDVIGLTGNSASAEIAIEPHIHFALKRNGEWIDPVQFVQPTAGK